MKTTEHNRIVKQLQAKHAAKLAEVEAYYKQELKDLQSQFDNLCEASRKQDERIAELTNPKRELLDPDKPMCQDDYEYFSGIMAGIVGSSKQA